MTSEDWMPNLPLACQTLLDPIGACENALKKALKEISAEFTWLNEIIEKNCRLLSGKSSGKTTNTGTAKIDAFGRQPCTNMSKKTVCTESQQSKTVSQKSRNPVCDIKPLMFKQSLTCSATQEDSKENRPPVRQLSDEKGCRNDSKTVTRAKAYFPAASRKCFDEKGADKILCPTAREVKQTVSKSMQRQDNTAGTMLVASKLNSAARIGSISKMSCEQKSSGYHSMNHLQNKESLWRNSTLKNRQIGKCKPLASICESQQLANVECHSHASGWHKASQLSEQREYSRDMFKSSTMKGMAARLNGFKATHLQNQSLNETITVVTEVFELMGNGQPARLKEFEIVKTKKAPVERAVKPDFTFLRTSNFDRPSASSDQGFNDCDQSVNASSDKSATLSLHNSTNQSDNICDLEEEIGALPHPLNVQETSEMVSSGNFATKPNKDSEIETEVVTSASVTKFTGHVKGSQAKTTTQKELVSKKTAAEDTQRVTRMGQRGNGNENFSKTRSINNPATGKQALAQRPKYCSRPDADSMALQKQKQHMLIVKKTRDEESLRKTADARTQKFEKHKRFGEEKKARHVVAGELKPFSGHEEKQTNKMLDAKLVEDKVLEQRCKDESDKQNQSLEKQLETETNKKEEFGKESEQSLEQEGKNREQEELTERNGNHLKSEQSRHRMEDSLEDLKEKLKEEKLRMKQVKEAKEREREQQRIEKEKQIAYERAEQQRIEREKKEERERTIKEEFEKLKAMEKERLEQKQKVQIQQQQQNTQSATVISKPKSSSLTLKPERSSITNTASAPANTNNSSLNREKQIAYEKAEQHRIEREKKEERERTIKEEFEKLKAMEKERLQQQQKIQIQQQQNTQSATVISTPKSILTLKPERASITNTAASITNTAASITNTAAAPANTNNSSLNSYEITPMKKNSINVKYSDPDDYGIEDKFSDESTDDDEAPKKKIPEWATGVALNTALITQFLKPPDLDEIFRISKIEPPNLALVFPTRRKLRYHWRTSSANWNSPPLKH